MPNLVLITTPEHLHAARHLLYVYSRPGGYAPGSFHYQLILAMEHADQNNLRKLLRAFPEYVPGMTLLTTLGASALERHVSEYVGGKL